MPTQQPIRARVLFWPYNKREHNVYIDGSLKSYKHNLSLDKTL